MLFKPSFYRYARTLFTLATLSAVLLMQGCFWESDDPAPATYSIGGTVAGLTGTVVLQNNAGSDLTITNNDSFSFGNNFSNGTSYAVTVLTNPSGQGCTVSNGTGSVNGATVSNIAVTCVDNADATGYYTGTLSVDGFSDSITVYALIYNNQLRLMSDANTTLYDGSMSITGNSFTANANIYQAGIKSSTTTTISGTITAGSQITGELIGSGVGNGTFTLTYADNNNDTADMPKVIRHTTDYWLWIIGNGQELNLAITNSTTLWSDPAAETGTFKACEIASGTINPINGSNLYSMTVTFNSCSDSNASIEYTGVATTTTGDATMVIMLINNNFAIYGDAAAM